MKNLFKRVKGQSGFTLIELLVVIAILSALGVVVFVALNPAQRLKDARDGKRTVDVDSILTAVHQYLIDNRGATLGLATSTEYQLGSAASGCAISTGGCTVVTAACANMSTALARYLKSIPVDPSLASSATTTSYSLVVDTNGMYTVRACGTEGTTNISVSR